VSVADVFDAITSDRPYRQGLNAEEAIEYLYKGAGSAHDPTCIDALAKAYVKGRIQTQNDRDDSSLTSES
jgi:HD-GYP domain-containing protein (c-di-GMP phosphodiesterase class II)